MKFTFIITTLGRKEELVKCVRSIEEAYEQSKYVEIEVIVISQRTICSMDELNVRYPGFFRIYHTDKQALSAARNSGIAKSSGDYLIFLDDDAGIKQDFLEQLNRVILPHQEKVLCGKIIDSLTGNYFSRLFKNNAPAYLGRLDFRYFMGSAHVLQRRLIEDIGLYDTAFGAGGRFHGAEETDLFFRLKRNGIKVLYVPNLVFFHPISLAVSAEKVFNYSFAVGAALTKQLIIDSANCLVYAFILGKTLLKNLLRSIQCLFMASARLKNERYHYRAVLAGTLRGMYEYVRYICA